MSNTLMLDYLAISPDSEGTEHEMKYVKTAVVLLGFAFTAGATFAQSRNDVVVINPFDVQAGQETQCLAAWDKAAMVLRDKPGFKSARLHRSSGSNAKSNFVTVGVWGTYEQYEAAITDPKFMTVFSTETCTGNPAPYRPIREIKGSGGSPSTINIPDFNQLYRA